MKQTQFSPVTGKPMKLTSRYCQIVYRCRHVGYRQSYYFCEDSRQKFTTTELDEKNLDGIVKAYAAIMNGDVYKAVKKNKRHEV